MIRIDFLGTGNAFTPSGRLHALTLIDGKILIDTPPTLITQLRRKGLKTSEIEYLLFTHWHADHTFGFPFFMLERKYISDPKREKDLKIYLRPGGKEKISNLCNIGFPGSLDDVEKMAHWHEEEVCELAGTNWSFERFPVCHTPETDPHGYELTHNTGIKVLHCGDSGPCEEIEIRAESADVVILEMGMPDIGTFPYHYTPSDVIDFSNKFPKSLVLVTHNFASSKNISEGFRVPELPKEVYQLEDGDAIEINQNGEIKIINNC
jgi:ribonuclease BN (tRNA processing enzyme)